MTNVLLVITSVAHVKELRRIADFLRTTDRFTPLFFSHIDTNYLQLRAYCRDERITLYDHEGARLVERADGVLNDPAASRSRGTAALVQDATSGPTVEPSPTIGVAAGPSVVPAQPSRAVSPAMDLSLIPGEISLIAAEISALHRTIAELTARTGELTARVAERIGFAPEPADFSLIAAEIDALRTIERSADRVLRTEAIDLVVLCEDNVEVASAIWIKTGHRLGIPTAIVPFTVATHQEAAETYFDDANFHADADGLSRQVALRFPKWALDYERRLVTGSHDGGDEAVEKQTLLRLPARRLLAREFLGLSPLLPWTLNSGDADVIAVESVAMLEHYQSCGLPEEQLVLTGSLADDAMENGLRNRATERAALLAEHEIANNRRILLCAFPPNQHPAERPGCEFADYASLVRYWAEALCRSPDWQVVVRPHPNSAPETLAALNEFPIVVSSRPTEALIPLCDLFVASVSATIRWAIACARPVVNYDVYHYGYTDYRAAPGVITVSRREDFEKTLARLTGNPLRRAVLIGRQRTVPGNWGVLERRSGTRLLDLFSGLTSSNARRHGEKV